MTTCLDVLIPYKSRWDSAGKVVFSTGHWGSLHTLFIYDLPPVVCRRVRVLFTLPVIWLDNRPTMGTSDWSDFLVVDWLDTSQSFYHPIIGCPDVTGSIWILCTIGLREHIQYIQSTCIHSTVFKHSWYDSVVYCYTIHLEMNSSPINIYIYSKAIFF